MFGTINDDACVAQFVPCVFELQTLRLEHEVFPQGGPDKYLSNLYDDQASESLGSERILSLFFLQALDLALVLPKPGAGQEVGLCRVDRELCSG